MTGQRTADDPLNQSRLLSPDLPWSARDLSTVLRLGLLGVLAITIGWIGGSGTVTTSRQAGWLGLAVLGNLVAGSAMIGWLLGGLRSVRGLKQQVLAELDERWPARVMSAAALPDVTGLVSVQGGRRYHLAGCRLVQGKATAAVTQAKHLKAGRQPCGMCLGDDA